MTNWAPRTALVTGASLGIGRGVALALAGIRPKFAFPARGHRILAMRRLPRTRYY